MTIIENDIQYNWVRRRVLKLKEKVNKDTPLDNRYRIELELLSKIEKEYSDKKASNLEKEKEFFDRNIDRKQVNIYEGLPLILEKINCVALSSVIGKSDSWIRNKLGHYVIKGKAKEFILTDLELINKGLILLGDEIMQNLVIYEEDREEVIEQIKELRKLVSMQYVCVEVLKENKRWMDSRMRHRPEGGKVCSFKEDDIHAINKAAMQIANELKSTELVL